VWTKSVLLLDPTAIKAINTIKYTTTISMENQENKVAKKKKKSKNIRAGRNQISPNFADCIGTSCK
jgi:tRNA(Ser,Leu) C12 N-acetylase TAN1